MRASKTILAVAVCAAVFAVAVPARAEKPALGINLEHVLDYARSMMFVDAMKAARPFGTPDAPWDEKAKLDANGWPTEDAGVVVMADVPVWPGVYTVTFTGRADVALVNTPGKVENTGYNRDTNTTTVTITIGDNVDRLFLSFKNTTGGIKNVRVLRPGYAADTKELFTKEFLELIKPFSTIRLMDYLATNNSTVKEWAERSKPTDANQSSDRGACFEYAIALANQTGKDLWVNVPDRASDDYVRELAKLLKSQLAADCVVYVEYSNEVWNTMFKAFHRNHEAAKAEVTAGDKTLTDNGADSNAYYWGYKRVARKTVEISKIFREVYGDAAMNTRVRPVLATQAANPFLGRLQIDYINKHHGAPSKYIYGIATAPYMGLGDKVSNREDLTVDDLFASHLPGAIAWVKDRNVDYAAIAKYYGVKLLAYEGGPGLEGEASVQAKVAANRDPRMADAMKSYFDAWYSTGGELFMYFNAAGPFGKYGQWGLTDDVRKPTVKNKFVASYVTVDRPPVTAGASVPAVLMAYEPTAKDGGGVEKSGDGGKNLAYIRTGNWFDYLLNVKTPGKYVVTVESATNSDVGEFELLLNNNSLGKVAAPNTGNWQKWGSTKPIEVELAAGQHVLRMKIAKAAMNVRSVTIAAKAAAKE